MSAPKDRFDVMLPLRLPPSHRLAARGFFADRSSGAALLGGRVGFLLLAVFMASLAVAQVQARPEQLPVFDLLIKWTPLLATGFLFNLAISFMSMAFWRSST